MRSSSAHLTHWLDWFGEFKVVQKRNPEKSIKGKKSDFCYSLTSLPLLVWQDNLFLSDSFAAGKNILFFEMYSAMTHLSVLCITKLLSPTFWLPKNLPFTEDPFISLLFWVSSPISSPNGSLDNSKYLLFSSPSHTCPHLSFFLIPRAFPLSFPAGRPPLLIVIKPFFFYSFLMSYEEDSNPSTGISAPHNP